MINELFKRTVKLKEYPEFKEATAQEVYEVALRLMELERLDRIESSLKDIDVSLCYLN